MTENIEVFLYLCSPTIILFLLAIVCNCIDKKSEPKKNNHFKTKKP